MTHDNMPACQNRPWVQPMVDRVVFDNSSTQIVSTRNGERANPLASKWVDAWNQARILLDLPQPDEAAPPPASAT
jgi:hypothetical protein